MLYRVCECKGTSGHIHLGCLVKWLASNHTLHCPMCKAPCMREVGLLTLVALLITNAFTFGFVLSCALRAPVLICQLLMFLVDAGYVGLKRLFI